MIWARLAGATILVSHAGMVLALPPVVTVDRQSTYDVTPRLTGAISDPTATTIQVTVGGGAFAATNNGNGTWALADNVINPALAPGIYNVAVLATSPQNGSGVDSTTGELTVLPGKANVFGSFDNAVTGPAANPPQNGSSANFFGGCLGTDITGTQCPTTSVVAVPDNPGTPAVNETAFLKRVSYGQAFGSRLPAENFIVATVDANRTKLYWQAPCNPPACTPAINNATAFRYRHEMYGLDGASQIILRNQTGILTAFWTATQRASAASVLSEIKDALRYAPTDDALRDVLLDVIYDTSAASLAAAREKTLEVSKIRLELVTPPGATGFVIDSEINYLKDALPLYDEALTGYMELLRDPLGIDVRGITSNSGEQSYPAGYVIFKQRVPNRSPKSEFYGTAGNFTLTPPACSPQPCTPPTYQIFDGYKDLVLIFDVLRDRAQTMRDLAWLYVLRSNPAQGSEPSDLEKASTLVKAGLGARYLELNTLLNVFRGQPGFSTTGANGVFGTGSSGARESLASLRSALSSLEGIKTFLDGQSNPLGFADDFLLLSQPNTASCPGAGACEAASSYNYWKTFLTGTNGPLTAASTKYTQARFDFVNYKDRLDNLTGQFQAKRDDFNARLLQIEGSNPATPFDNVGSELWQAKKDEELGGLHIQQNGVEIRNLEKEIEIEADRAARENGHYGQMQDTVIRYGNKQAELTKQISYIKAAQAAANNSAAGIGQAFTSFGTSLFAQGANAALQAGAEITIGTLSAHKEQLAASERAALLDQTGQILQDNSKARIDTLALRMNSLALDSLENAVLLTKTVGRTAALISERDDLYRRRDESNTSLATRYFADPIHRLTSDTSVVKADQSFREAQTWLFVALRALEYKRNSPFVYASQGGLTWTSDSLFKVRNASELVDMKSAMDAFDAAASGGTIVEDFDFPFSIKKTFLGYVPVPTNPALPISLSNPEKPVYVDPISGNLVKSDQAWRSWLSKNLKTWDSGDSPTGACTYPGSQVLRLDFDTAFNPKLSGFFDPNRYSEKIDLIRISLDLPVPLGAANKPACLTYGGTARIRNQARGVVTDPNQPDRLVGETTDYVSRHYLYNTATARIQPVDALDASVSVLAANIDPNSPAPPSSYNVDALRERSLATTHWTLVIPYLNNGTRTINIEDARDVTLWFYWHYMVPRL